MRTILPGTSILSTLFLLVSVLPVAAQVGGLSGSKLSAFCTDVVDDKTVEFEPAVYHFVSNKEWDKDGKLVNSNKIAGIAFALTLTFK